MLAVHWLVATQQSCCGQAAVSLLLPAVAAHLILLSSSSCSPASCLQLTLLILKATDSVA